MTEMGGQYHRNIHLEIPNDLFETISTENLILTCINYPAFGHYTAFENVQKGIGHIILNFNGLQELLNRSDATSELLSIYMQMDSLTMNILNKKVNKDFWPIRRSYFELLKFRSCRMC